MGEKHRFKEQIEDLIQANGWEGLLTVEPLLEGNPAAKGVRVKLSSEHSTAPSTIVNDYLEGVHSFEQIQQECLRALRTGRTGI